MFALRWPHVLLNEDGTGLIQIVDSKSKAARRVLPMTPRVHALLLARHDAAAGQRTVGFSPAAALAATSTVMRQGNSTPRGLMILV